MASIWAFSLITSVEAAMTNQNYSPRFQSFCLGTLTLIAVGFVLSEARSVFLPLVVAWLLSYLLIPLLQQLRHWGVPLWLALTTVMLGLLFSGVYGGTALSRLIADLIQSFPAYSERMQAIMKDVTALLHIPPDVWERVNWAQPLQGFLVSVSASLLSITTSTTMVVVFLAFILAGTSRLESKIRSALPAENMRVLHILETLSHDISQYLIWTTLINGFVGITIWLSLEMLGVHFAGTWGVLAFVLNFIPNLGGIIACVPPVLIAVVQSYPDMWLTVLSAIAVGTIELIAGSLLIPKVMGDRLDLSPLVILLFLLFWGWLWGVAGALLSLPIAVIVRIVCDNVESLHPLAVMMSSGRTDPKE